MPQLESIIQKMIDAGESEDNIAAVIKEYNQPKIQGDTYKGPDTFWGGVKESINKYEPLKANMSGLKGYAKGALLDLPSSIVGSIKGIGNAIVNPMDAASSAYQSMKELPSNVMNTVSQAGSHPEEFGRMMGRMTGQPAVTAGLTKGIPYAPQAAISGARMIGTPIAAAGGIIKRFQPLSGLTPRFMDMRTLRNVERAAGRGIQNIGEGMQSLITPEGLKPDFIKSLPSKIFKFTDKELTTKLLPKPQKLLGAGPRFQAGKEGINDVLNPKSTPITPMGPSNELKIRLDANGKFIDTITGEEIGPLSYKGEFEPWKGAKNIADAVNKFMPESRVFPSFKGNPSKIRPPHTRIFDKSGVNDKIDNPPPNQRARMFRGTHDSSEIFFEDPIDREIFGSGQNPWSKGQIKPGALERLAQTSKRIVTKYNLSEREAQSLILDYNKHVRQLGSKLPKYGENLNFTAPSFETFMGGKR